MYDDDGVVLLVAPFAVPEANLYFWPRNGVLQRRRQIVRGVASAQLLFPETKTDDETLVNEQNIYNSKGLAP